VITLRGYQLDIAAQPNNKSIQGLLGNYNGVASDDLISRNGQTVAADATEETIYNEFGETCELMSPLYPAALIFNAREGTIELFTVSPYFHRACRLQKSL